MMILEHLPSACVLLPLIFATVAFGGKILIYSPRIGHSHVNFMGRIADILVQQGHDVVVLIPSWNSEVHDNGTELARIIVKPVKAVFPFTSKITHRVWTSRGDSLLEMFRLYRVYVNVQMKSCEEELTDINLMKSLRMEKFDLGITEIVSFCGYAIFKQLGIKNYVSASATNLFEVISDPLGVSSNPSYVPAALSENTDEMSYLERFGNMMSYAASYFLTKYLMIEITQPLSALITYGYDLEEFIRNSSIAFINTEELLEFPRLVSHKIVFVGGIAVSKTKLLNNFYGRLMNESKQGVALVAFGSMAQSAMMTETKKQSFLQAFRSFPEIKFIWKYEADDATATDLPNVVKKKWVPQNDLLHHPNLRTFISHCGQNSVMESVHAGVPLICIPLYGDQMRNAKAVEKRHVAIIVEKNRLNEQTLAAALKKVLYDQKYRESSRRLAEMIRDKPVSARERIIMSTEFVLKFGPTQSLSPAGVKLNFFQYYLLDVILPPLLFLILLTYIFGRLVIKRTAIMFATNEKVKSD